MSVMYHLSVGSRQSQNQRVGARKTQACKIRMYIASSSRCMFVRDARQNKAAMEESASCHLTVHFIIWRTPGTPFAAC